MTLCHGPSSAPHLLEITSSWISMSLIGALAIHDDGSGGAIGAETIHAG
jgi:hypothetical protein